MYTKNPYEVPAAGFILVDNLSELIEDSPTRLRPDFAENLLKMVTDFKMKEMKKQQRQKMREKKLEKLNLFKKPRGSTSQYNIYFETELKQIQETYSRITELISDFLDEERNEMLGYMKRQKEISNLGKECEQQTMWKRKLFILQQRQKKQLDELQFFLRSVLKHQDVVRYELLTNAEKLEDRLQVVLSGTNAFSLHVVCYDYYRIGRIKMYQTKIEKNLKNIRRRMEDTIRDACKTQWKLDGLKLQVIFITIFSYAVLAFYQPFS